VFPFLILALILLLSGCSHPKAAKTNLPPPPAIESENTPDVEPEAKPAKPEEAFVWRSIDPDRPRRNVWDAPPQIKVRIDTSAPPDRDAAEPAPERPPP